MANEDHVRILKEGSGRWNAWREENPGIKPDLHGANLRGCPVADQVLAEQGLRCADLDDIPVRELDDLMVCELEGANIVITNLRYMNLKGADLSEADLGWTDLRCAKLNDANLRNARLDHAHMVDTNLDGAILTGCSVFGISAWDLKGKPSDQSNLIITRSGTPTITVDNLQVAQFIYFLLHNEDIRQVIDTITSKVVLILGRFTPERTAVLNAIREELRKLSYVPVVFYFETPDSRDLMETVATLAHMARFIIADITDPKSVPAELEHIAPGLPSVPVMPIILRSDYEYALFRSLMRRCSWILEPYQYENMEELIASIGERIIVPAENKARECRTP